MNGNPPQANESPVQPNVSPAANTNTQPATTAAAPTLAATTACPVPTCDANAKAVNTTKCDVCKLVLCSAPSVPQPVVQSRRRPLLGPSPG